MLMSDIIQRFRDENPELDANVISDATLMSWLLDGDLETCTRVRLINQEGISIPAVSGTSTYDLTKTTALFLDIDESVGGGLCYYNTSGSYKRIDRVTKAWLDNNNSQWRTASSGTPRYYYRYGQNIIVYPKPDSTIVNFTVDLILLSNPFINLNQMPFNQLPYLAPFHASLKLYLMWRAKIKIGKSDESDAALKAYVAYTDWMIKTIGGAKYGVIEFRPTGLPSQGYQR